MSERLVRQYPAFADQITELSKAGTSEQKIEAGIHDLIREKQREGYSPGEIDMWMRGGPRESNPAREFVRGLGHELTLGYGSKLPGDFGPAFKAGEQITPEATPGEIAGRTAGEFLGQVAPFGLAARAANLGFRGITAAARGAGPLIENLARIGQTGLSVLTGGAAVAGARAESAGRRLEAAEEALGDPWMLLGAAGGGVVHAAGKARAAAAKAPPAPPSEGPTLARQAGRVVAGGPRLMPEDKIAKGLQTVIERGNAKGLETVDTETPKTPTKQQVQADSNPQQTAPGSKYENLSDKNLLSFIEADVQNTGKFTDQALKAEVEKRALASPAYAQLVRETLLKHTPEEPESPAAPRERKTGAQSSAEKVLEEAATGDQAGRISTFGTNDLQAAAQTLSDRMRTLERRGVNTERHANALKLIQAEIEKRTEVLGKKRAAQEIKLTLDDALQADHVHLRSTSEGIVTADLYTEYAGNRFFKTGEAIFPEDSFYANDFRGRVSDKAPANIVAERPDPHAGSMTRTILDRARDIFKGNEPISFQRIQRVLGITRESALNIAKELRKEKGEAEPPGESTVGAAQYSGDPNIKPNVQAAIDGLQEQLDRLRLQGREGSNFGKGLESAINELRTQGKLTPETKKLLGFQESAKELRARTATPEEQAAAQAKATEPTVPTPVVETTFPARDETLGPSSDVAPPPPAEGPKPPSALLDPVLKETLPARPKEDVYQVVVRQGDKVVRTYDGLNEARAKDILETTQSFFTDSGLSDYTSTLRKVLPDADPSAPREGKSRSTGLGKSRRVEIPVGTAADVERPEVLRGAAAAAGEGTAPTPAPAPVYTTSALKELADMKGMSLSIDYETGKPLKIKVVTETGSTLTTSDLKTATQFLMEQPDKARTTAVNKGLAGEKLTQADRVEIDKFATDKAKIEPRESDPPVLSEDIEGQPPERPPISGGSGNAALPTDTFLRMVAQQNDFSIPKTDAFIHLMTRLFDEHPGLEVAYRAEIAAPAGRAAFMNPADFIAMPQFSGNPVIRIITSDGVYKHSIPKYYEMRQWIEYHNQWWGDLTVDQRKDLSKVMRGLGDRDALDPKTTQALVAAEKFVDDMSRRIDDPTWSQYLHSLIDKQKAYQSYKTLLSGWDTFADLPDSMKVRFGGSPERFEMVQRAFRKNENYEDLPKDVKRIFNKNLVEWIPNSVYDQLPEGIQRMVPKEMWEKFSFTGGWPVVEDWVAAWKSIMPVMMGEIYTKPFFEKWQPLMDTLPGNINGTSTRAYLYKWSQMAKGNAERSGLSDTVDGIVRRVENATGRSIADVQFLDRFATRTGLAVYQSTLGLALDTATLNMFQSINTWAETGKIGSTILRKLTDSEFKDLIKQVPKDVGILQEMNWHTLTGEQTGGLGLPAWLQKIGVSKDALQKYDQTVTKIVMHPMHIAENINRGVAFAAGLEEALAMGLDAQTALRLGIGRASQVVPNLTLTEAHVHALSKVAKTQFAYEKEFQSPYMQGSLWKLSTLFWSYPTKQLQFMSHNVADAYYKAWTDPRWENMARATRFTALAGLTIGGPLAGSYAGVNLENVFGSGAFPRIMSLPVQTMMTAYQMVLGRDPVKEQDFLNMWKGALYMVGIPGVRYAQKFLDITGIPGMFQGSMQKGFTENRYGQRMYNTTSYGELMRLFGIEIGDTYKERQIVRTTLEQEAKINQEKRNAISLAVTKQDMSKVTEFNAKYGTKYRGEMITGEDIATWARRAATPLVDRAGRRGIREVEAGAAGYRP